jgi:hypothetical protein
MVLWRLIRRAGLGGQAKGRGALGLCSLLSLDQDLAVCFEHLARPGHHVYPAGIHKGKGQIWTKISPSDLNTTPALVTMFILQVVIKR